MLTLRIISYQRLSPGQSPQHAVDRGRCTIGRAPENDWVLADPEMVLSKSHCAIDCRDGDYYLTDTSTNGVYVNQSEQRLGRGNTVKLKHDDVLILGDYEIQVSLEAAGAGAAPAGSAADDLFGDQTEQLGLQNWDQKPVDSLSASTSDDPLVEPMTDPLGLDDDGNDSDEWRSHSEFDHLPSEQAFFQAPGAVPEPPVEKPADDRPPPQSESTSAKQVIPDDWEDSLIFRSPPATPESVQPPASPPEEEEDPFDFLDVPPEADSIEASSAQPAPDPVAPEQLESDPLDLGEPLQPVEPVPPPAEPAPAVPVKPVSPEPRRAAVPEEAPRGGSGSGGEALQAFLRGSGLQSSDIPAGVSAEVLMEQFGKLFRQTSQGMMELLRARSSIKNEFRIERTMVGPVANNPLKVLPTVEEAMKAMLSRHEDIWMPADRSVREGFEDIRAHELAMIAGMQAALGQLLASFDPAQLEEELGQQSRLSDLMAGGRKARYWDAFTRLYGKLAARAEDDFQELFRKEFARAYEEQLSKLRQH